MSGPKSYSYSVSPAELERRRLAAELVGRNSARSARLEIERAAALELFAAEDLLVGAEKPTVEELPALNGTPEQNSAALDRFESQLGRSMARFTEAVQSKKIAETLGGIGAEVDKSESLESLLSRFTDSVQQESADVAQVQDVPRRDMMEIAETICSRLLSRIDPGVLDTEMADAKMLSDRVIAARTQVEIELAVGRLRECVMKVNDDANVRAEKTIAVKGWRDELAGIGTTAAAELADRLTTLPDGQPPSAELESSVIGYLADHRSAVAREHTNEALVDVLSELGYSIGPEFSTRLAGQDFADFDRDEWRHHGVRVSIDTDASIAFIPTNDGSSDVSSRHDAEFERHWCEELPEICSMLEERGILTSRIHAVPPGELAPLTISDTRRRTTTTKKPEERSVD